MSYDFLAKLNAKRQLFCRAQQHSEQFSVQQLGLDCQTCGERSRTIQAHNEAQLPDLAIRQERLSVQHHLDHYTNASYLHQKWIF